MNSGEYLDRILEEFSRIATIPRPSHHEKQIGAYLCDWAQRHNLPYILDELGNVIIDKPAAIGYERAPKVILQAHMDMVCVAEKGISYNPLKDAINVVNDGSFLFAEGTSLGADDGIGIAIALCLLSDESILHGPLRALFTVNEEDGMASGAIDPKYLDADYLINLDWEWLGSLCNSSAGGDFMAFTRKYKSMKADDTYSALKIELSGLLGGHSGVDIHKGRVNAIVCISRLLQRLSDEQIRYQLNDFHGGQARNAIPASAEATISVHPDSISEVYKTIKVYDNELKAAFGEIEPGMALRCTVPDERPSSVIPKEDADALFDLILTLPNGVHTMSPYVGGLVESSQNLGRLEHTKGELRLAAMARSCVPYRANELLAISSAVARAQGFTYEQGEHSPAWAVNPKSKLTPLTCLIYKELTGNDMVVEPVHGALECGAFYEKNPHLDMIAIGPSLFDVHTPKERCDLHSVQVTNDLVIGILERLCE